MTDIEPTPPPPQHRVYCNRTLNLRAIQAVGYDMDYTLIHYREDAWEQRAYAHLQRSFAEAGWPVAGLRFDAQMMERGLVLDTELGNVLEANRFGFVKQARHGTRRLDYRELPSTYARTIVDLHDHRFVFLNTLFSLSEGCMYAQLVDLLDARGLPEVLGYRDLYARVKRNLDRAHMEGELKAEILADPDRFVELDPETPLALLDQREAGKKLLLITNSGWEYTHPMMAFAFDRYLPGSMTWRDLFHLIIVDARKPDFFAGSSPLFEVVSDDGLLRPAPSGPAQGKVYLGGNARMVEQELGLLGQQILYVGDHIFGDVHVTKEILRWRTALVLRELEREIASTLAFAERQRELSSLMAAKEDLERRQCQLRLMLQRRERGRADVPEGAATGKVLGELSRLRARIQELDERIAPLAAASAEVGHPVWGPMMRAGNDKSLLARMVERSADIYMSRVSCLLHVTPFAYLRSPRGSLPHDPCPGA